MRYFRVTLLSTYDRFCATCLINQQTVANPLYVFYQYSYDRRKLYIYNSYFIYTSNINTLDLFIKKYKAIFSKTRCQHTNLSPLLLSVKEWRSEVLLPAKHWKISAKKVIILLHQNCLTYLIVMDPKLYIFYIYVINWITISKLILSPRLCL